MTGLIDFSTDAASNDVAAPPINWVEGMPARVVNDSARAMMAALAAWRMDNSGLLSASGGAGNAYALSTYQIFRESSLGNGATLGFTVDAANVGPATLAVDGLTPRPIRRSGGFELAPGDLQPFVVHRVTYHPVLAYFTLLSPESARPGRIMAFGGDGAVPAGWVPCDGRAVSRSAYSALLSTIGFAYGSGDGATTFNVPDLRGRTLFGVDAGANRLTGAGGLGGGLGSAGGTETVTLSNAQMPAHNHSGNTGSGGGSSATTTGSGGGHDHSGATGSAGNHTHAGTSDTGGNHTHSGRTAQVGDHYHGTITAAIKGGAAGGNGNPAAYWLSPDAAINTSAAGAHDHALNIDQVAGHTHTFTTNGGGDHTHPISAVADHSHSIPAIADHAHSIAPDGSGAAHTNMPPGLVIVFAIKA